MKVINGNIFIDSGLMNNRALLSEILRSEKILVVTDNLVPSLYVENLYAVCQSKNIEIIKLQAGEHNKNFLAIEKILACLMSARANRLSTIIALGGGVVGDLAGFAAAIYMRGINWIQIPTTLIAQVDSAYGGKTACNYQDKKNVLGAFHFPKAVLVDPEYVQTLSSREYNSGLAEVVKYGVACDKGFFEWLELNKYDIKNRNSYVLQALVETCCEIKTNIVIRDPKDQNERMILNFGHSFGHALEAATSFSVYLHGEAVSIGMLLATLLAVRIGILERNVLDRLRELLEYFELPITGLPINVLYDYMVNDKKNHDYTLKLILPYALGKVKLVADISREYLEDLLQSYAE